MDKQKLLNRASTPKNAKSTNKRSTHTHETPKDVKPSEELLLQTGSASKSRPGTFVENRDSKNDSNGINMYLSTESPKNLLNSVESSANRYSLINNKNFGTQGSGNPTEFIVKEIHISDRIDEHYKSSILSESKRAQ